MALANTRHAWTIAAQCFNHVPGNDVLEERPPAAFNHRPNQPLLRGPIHGCGLAHLGGTGRAANVGAGAVSAEPACSTTSLTGDTCTGGASVALSSFCRKTLGFSDRNPS